jgi:Flp pilus assembly protein TadB
VSGPAAGLRIGDTERAAAADRLAWHFSQGRLDQAELDERLDRAMRAATAGDLTRLFADLPDAEPVPAAGARPRAAGRPHPARGQRRPRLAPIVLAVCIVACVVFVLHALTQSLAVLAVIVLIAVLWLRRGHVGGRGSPPSTP